MEYEAVELTEKMIVGTTARTSMDLKRTWTGDFEEYVDSNMTGDATINIYIAIA